MSLVREAKDFVLEQWKTSDWWRTDFCSYSMEDRFIVEQAIQTALEKMVEDEADREAKQTDKRMVDEDSSSI
jgi:hypothetical protein